MTYTHLLSILKAARLSPEQLAKRMDISGITLRRWKSHPPKTELPELYSKSLVNAIQALVTEGKLPIELPAVQSAMKADEQSHVPTALSILGIKASTLEGGTSNEQDLLESLHRIGSEEHRKEQVDKHRTLVMAFKAKGREWSKRVTALWDVISSKDMNGFDKVIAYGALFYLVTPFDLIPDYVPVFGYMDDFLVLGFAATYYLRRFPPVAR